jgi:hypothetical protein
VASRVRRQLASLLLFPLTPQRDSDDQNYRYSPANSAEIGCGRQEMPTFNHYEPDLSPVHLCVFVVVG